MFAWRRSGVQVGEGPFRGCVSASSFAGAHREYVIVTALGQGGFIDRMCRFLLVQIAHRRAGLKRLDASLCHWACAVVGKVYLMVADLFGGYLDIELDRGRANMSIYDPVAALVACWPDAFV